MTFNKTWRDIVASAVVVGAIALYGAGGTTANAQSTTASADQSQTTPTPPASKNDQATVLQEIVVTGSMIERPASETAEAITVIKADSLKNLGIVNIEQALSTITSNTTSLNIAQSVGTFSGGGTYANLRNLGNGRTLVLLDGHRLADNAFSGNAVDLSGIPFSAIESVQVLREGASALYGSDAIAGVINFITKKDYRGAEIDGTYNYPQASGGATANANFTFGHGSLAENGYNFMITGSYSRQNELQATQRGFSASGFNPAEGIVNTNGIGTWPATFQDANGNLWEPGYPACAGNPFVTTYFGSCQYRYSAATDLLPYSKNLSGLASFTKTLPGNNTLGIQYFYARNKVIAWSGPIFYFFQMTPQADPTYYPTAAGLTCVSAPCSAPPALNGPISVFWTPPDNARYGDNINTEQRALISFSGDNAGWRYALHLNYSQNENEDGNVGGYPNENLLATGGSGGILSNLINPFGPQSAAGETLINNSYINGIYQTGKMKRWSVSGHASHKLGDAFHAGRNAVVAMGFDVRGNHFDSATTPYNNLVSQATGLTDFAVAGSRTAQALFVELNVPMAKSLDVDVSDREDRYSDFGRTNNGKVTVRYQPTRYLTFRGAASTGFRAPTLYDLYNPPTLSASTGGTVGNVSPICQSGNYTTLWSSTVCSNQGIGLFGGNPNLTPETSQNFDFGIIVEPIRNLGITLDYYRILLKNTISNIPANSIYQEPATFANYIKANNQGTLTPSIQEGADCNPYTAPTCGYIIVNDQNTGHLSTDGLDLSVRYLQHTSIGTFREDLEGTATTQFLVQQYTGGPTYNVVGEWNHSIAPAIRWQHELRVDWTSPGREWGAGLANHFMTGYVDEFGIGPTNSGPLRHVGNQSTWDVYASYRPDYRPIRGMTVLFGIRNLFNTNPPFTNAQQGNFAAGYSSLFSNPILRDFYLNLKYKFL